MKKNYNISLLKILACFAVVALHTQRDYNLMTIHNPILYYLSRMAIPIFFMVNGYLILKKERNRLYYLKKIIDIILFISLWSLMISLLKRQNPLYILYNSIFSSGTLSVYWFFWALILIYILNIIINKYLKEKKYKVIILTISIIISIIIDIVQIVYLFEEGIIIKKSVPQVFRIWTWVTYFYLGGTIDVIINKFKILQKNKFVFLSCIILSIICFLLQYYIFYIKFKIINSEFIYDNIIILLWCMSIFIFISKLNIENDYFKKIIDFTSNYTMGIYAFHMFIIRIFHLTSHTKGWLYSTMIWGGTIICCIVISYFVNKIPIFRSLVNMGYLNKKIDGGSK